MFQLILRVFGHHTSAIVAFSVVKYHKNVAPVGSTLHLSVPNKLQYIVEIKDFAVCHLLVHTSLFYSLAGSSRTLNMLHLAYAWLVRKF